MVPSECSREKIASKCLTFQEVQYILSYPNLTRSKWFRSLKSHELLRLKVISAIYQLKKYCSIPIYRSCDIYFCQNHNLWFFTTKYNSRYQSWTFLYSSTVNSNVPLKFTIKIWQESNQYSWSYVKKLAKIWITRS